MSRYIAIASGTLALGLLSLGCAPLIPRQLADARAAYQHADGSRAAEAGAIDLRQAKEALAAAERSFRAQPRSQETLDLAYVAERRAQLAEARAGSAAK